MSDEKDNHAERKVLEAARAIKEYCESNLCYDCPMRFTECKRNLPCGWKLPAEP